MARYRVTASARIEAPADRVYALVADYRDGHPRILPRRYFTALEVEEGGVGAGTRIRVQMRLLGRTRIFRATITEPEPGRVLAESDAVSGTVTTFTVVPLEGSRQSEVTISTELPMRDGLAGRLERFLATRVLPRVYNEELRLLREVVEDRK
jgi:Polyketide cyclase / dehydrase and lipid transport